MKFERAEQLIDGKKLVTGLLIQARTTDEARVLTEYAEEVELNGIHLQEHLALTLATIREKGDCTVAEVAEALDLKSTTATNNRFAHLFKRGFVVRREACVPAGGRNYVYTAREIEEIPNV